MDYYYEQLDSGQKRFYLDLCEGLRERKERVKATPGLSKEEFSDTVQAVQYDHPEFWFVDFSHYVYYTHKSRYEIEISYHYDEETTRRKEAQIRNITQRILAAMQKDRADSVYQKCLWLHNMMVRNCTYNYDALGHSDERFAAYTMEGFFMEHTAVCSGIAKAFRYLCSAAGVDAIVARGYSLHPGKRDYERHAWNLIRSGESTAYIDVTWDICMSEHTDMIRYDYFFLPDIEMMRDHQYVGYPFCKQLRCSYFDRTNSLVNQTSELDSLVRKAVQKSIVDKKSPQAPVYFKLGDKRQTKKELVDYVNKQFREHITGNYTLYSSVNDTQSIYLLYVVLKPGAHFIQKK